MRDGQDDSRKELAEAHDFSLGQRLGLLILNYISVVLVAGILSAVLIPWGHLGWRLLTGLFLLYLCPPLLVRLILIISPVRQGVVKIGTTNFFKWWGIFNLQVIFCRFPALEELIRLVPGLYSAWLRLWGARIGRLTYWAAGMRILDRSFIRIGDDVIFGAGVRLNPHVMARNDQGDVELLLADVVIGDRAMIGGYSLLTTGTVVGPRESIRACLLSPPFTRWQGGRRARDERQPLVPSPDSQAAYPEDDDHDDSLEGTGTQGDSSRHVGGDHGKSP